MLTEKIKLRNRIVMAPMQPGQLILMEPSLSKNSNFIKSLTKCWFSNNRMHLCHAKRLGFTHEFAAYDDRFINSLEK